MKFPRNIIFTCLDLCPESLNWGGEAGTEEDRLTKYFSDANVVNLVGCVWQTPPTPSLPPPTHMSPSIRNSCLVPDWPATTTEPATSNLAKLLESPAIYYEIISDHLCSVSWAPDMVCVIRPLVPLLMEPWTPASAPVSLHFIYNFSNCWIKHL